MWNWIIEHGFRAGNLIEGFLWISIGLGFAVSLLGPRLRDRKLVAMIAFFLFGVSDLIEMNYQCWWAPWWLLVWKGACVVMFLLLLLDHAVRHRKQH